MEAPEALNVKLLPWQILVAVVAILIVGFGSIEKLEVMVAEQTPFTPINVLVARAAFGENGVTGVNTIVGPVGVDAV